jgi:hypothetical protein
MEIRRSRFIRITLQKSSCLGLVPGDCILTAALSAPILIRYG